MPQFPVPTVSLVENRPCTTSLAIAEHFGKAHKNVIRDIEALIADCPEDFHRLNFELMSRKVKIGNGAEREEPFYNVFFDGFILLVMGYTGPKALQMKLAYIGAFNAMREKLEGKKRNTRKKALAPAKDKFEAYLEEVEATRVKTMHEMSRLISMGLDLLDVYKFRTATHHMFTYILMDWLALVLVRPTRVETRITADDCSPVALIRELDKLLPDIRR